MRRLFNFLVIFSLLVCLAAAGVWIRSLSHSDWFYRATWNPKTRLSTNADIQLNPGQILADYDWLHIPATEPAPASANYRWQHVQRGHFAHGMEDDLSAWRWKRYIYFWSSDIWNRRPGQRYYQLGLRLWPVVTLSAVLPLLWLWRHRPRPRPGHCKRCGYDLRASPERCPECGTPAQKNPPPAPVVADVSPT